MDTLNLSAQPRETGKAATKAVRGQDQVPCVLYGAHQEPVHFAVETLDLRPLIHTSETYRVVVTVEGESYEAILKTVDFHPISDTPIHADFQALTAGETLTMTVPIHLQGSAPGVKAGGVLSQPLNELTIKCLPKDIPGHITIDVSTMEMGDVLHVSDLNLGENIEVLTEQARTLVSVTTPRAEVVEETEDEGLALGIEGAVPEAAEGDAEEAEGDEAAE